MLVRFLWVKSHLYPQERASTYKRIYTYIYIYSAWECLCVKGGVIMRKKRSVYAWKGGVFMRG